MPDLKLIMDKILPGMATASLTGVIFLIGFIAVTNYKLDEVKKNNEKLETRVSKLEETRFRPTDFSYGIEPLKTEMRYMGDDIKEIKEILKKANK